MKTTAKVTNSL